MDYNTRDGSETRSSGFGASSPCFKLILARPAVLSVTTDLSVSTSRNLVVPFAPLATAILYRPVVRHTQNGGGFLDQPVRQYRLLALKGMPLSYFFMPFFFFSLLPEFS